MKLSEYIYQSIAAVLLPHQRWLDATRPHSLTIIVRISPTSGLPSKTVLTVSFEEPAEGGANLDSLPDRTSVSSYKRASAK